MVAFYDLECTRIIEGISHPDVMIPRSEISIDAILVSKERGIADRYHLTWLVNDKLFTQVFSTEGGTFEHDDEYEITLRYCPKSILISSIQLSDLFRHQPRITPYRIQDKQPMIVEGSSRMICRFKFSRRSTLPAWFWEGISAIPKYIEESTSFLRDM